MFISIVVGGDFSFVDKKKFWSLRFLIDELYFYYGEFMRIKVEVGGMFLYKDYQIGCIQLL